MKYVLAVLTVCFSICSCSGSKPASKGPDAKAVPVVTDKNGYSQNNGPTYGPKYSEHSQSDWPITLDVKTAIMSDAILSLSARQVCVSTTDGIVTLSGKVPNKQAMLKMIKLVKGIYSVKAVNNQLQVSP